MPVETDGNYRVTVNSYLAGGGSGFSVLTEGTDRVGGDVDVDALVAYFAENEDGAPGTAGPDHAVELKRACLLLVISKQFLIL